ncbi:MAG: helix-turn-helix transcriptional regulator [bacterium]
MTKLSIKLGQRIKEIRERQNIKQVELAEMIEMEPSNLSKLENGNQLPKEENIERIARALNVDVKDLFEFGHIKTREELLEIITSSLKNYTKNELEFVYKFLVGLKEYKK